LARLPQLRGPTVIASFQGWNDAGDAASTATAFIARAWSATPFAEIDPEEFLDFTDNRPEVRIVEGETREVMWPATVFSTCSPPGGSAPFDAVLVRGYEPQLRWRTYCKLVLDVVKTIGATQVITVGALLAEVAHTHPVPVVATATNRRLLEQHGFSKSRYEGPTGIVGVLHAALADAGIPSISLWASVPYYVPQMISAKAALALVARVEQLLSLPVDTAELRELAAVYEREVDSLVAEDDDIAAYVARLQEMGEVEGDDVVFHDLADEVERYLRDQRHH
jgi:hypothetical protein